MTLNGVMAVAMRYFIEFGSYRAHYVDVVEDTPTLSAAEYLLRYSRRIPRTSALCIGGRICDIITILLSNYYFQFNCKSDFAVMKFL